jgi:ParB-like chromosome segregation protein Spo0J
VDVLSIRVDQISVPPRLRALDQNEVKRLAASLREIGLKQPISVRLASHGVTEDGEVIENKPLLVAGRHRLEAMRSLGWSHAPCIEVDDDDLLAEMWEIAENLHRCDLTKEQRDQHIRRYAELLELQSEQPAAIESKREDGRGHRPQGIAAKVAEATGLSKDTIRRALNPQPKPERGLAEFSASESRAEAREWSALVGQWNRTRPSLRQRLLDAAAGSTAAIE